MSSFLNADQILAADDYATKEVEVPEWGGKVLIKTMTGAERDEFEQSTVKQRGNKQEANMSNFRARLIALCVVDENGNKLFTNKHQVVQLGKKSVAPLQRVFNAIQELNGMTEADVEDLTEGFDEEDDADSTSA